MPNKITNPEYHRKSGYGAIIIAAFLLIFIFTISYFSIQGDVYTFDETAHIGAGYSYLTQQDYRLNPEHPPLIKDLAALPLLFLNLNFPKDHPSWTQEGNPVWWLQFDFANQFLYHSGNNPDLIMLWSKIPMILLLVFTGWFLFFWTKQKFGNTAALIALFLFSFSPTLIAHGRLVTTDIAAALGAMLSTYFWIKFLENPTRKNIILAGVILGISLLMKFSLILLIPFLGIITVLYIILNKKPLIKYISMSVIAGIIAVIFIIYPIYQFHILNYPYEQQLKDTIFYMETSSLPKPIIKGAIWMAEQPILRPLAHYSTGLLLAINRSATGNTTFFNGQVSAQGQKLYFPTVYLIKEPLSFHILTILSLISVIIFIKRKRFNLKELIQNYFTEFSLITFIAIYWLTSINSELNIGVRHLLPVFPLTMMLIGGAISKYIAPPYLKFKIIILTIIALWQVISVINAYPHFIAYFNELVGGSKNGRYYVVDSNLDWGQDLKRFQKWATQNNIGEFYADYFGGGDMSYYFGEQYKRWDKNNTKEDLPPGSYLVMSISQMQGGQGVPAPDFDGEHGYYLWLKDYKPIKIIGNSIFVYKIDK